MGKGVMIAGTHSGSGKTTVGLGLLGALSKKYTVTPFKVGPDYIDTAYHKFVCGRVSYNLDVFMLGEERLKALYGLKSDGDIALVEGVMGLFDGLDTQGFGSSAHVAKILNLPVILVIDASGMARSASAMVGGFRDFDREVNIAGVILNKVGGQKHYELLKQSIERDTGVPVFGFIPGDPELCLPERYLGLVPVYEMEGLKKKFHRLYSYIERYIDLDGILRTAEKAGSLDIKGQVPAFADFCVNNEAVKIAVAMDEAFNFYYQSGLEVFRDMGAKLVPFSPLHDIALPDGISGLYLGGGFPEMFAGQLSRNLPMLESIKNSIESGLPTYAECGGFIYLSRCIRDQEGKSYPMAGVYDIEAVMTRRLQHFGYVEAEVTSENVLAEKGFKLRGHEFHHSEMVGFFENTCYLVGKPGKPEKWRCGYRFKNCLATYVHIDFFAYPNLAENFLRKCLEFLKRSEFK